MGNCLETLNSAVEVDQKVGGGVRAKLRDTTGKQKKKEGFESMLFYLLPC